MDHADDDGGVAVELQHPNRINNSSRLVRLNVGGKLFQTTLSTLQSNPGSLLAHATLSSSTANTNSTRRNEDEDEDEDEDTPSTFFIDRDPDLFSVLLSLLRSGRLPSSASLHFSPQDLLRESLYYGIEPLLRTALSPPPLLGFDASLLSTVRPAADAFPTSISPDLLHGGGGGSLWVAHGGQISSYDWTLSHVRTVRTHLDRITSLRRAWPHISAVGSLDSPGLHLYDVSTGRHLGSAHWSDPSDPRVYKARVTTVAAPHPSPGFPLLAAFECPHRENCILSIDRSSLKVLSEIGRQNGSSTKAAAPGKLVDLPERGLVFASSVHSGAFGYSGYMKLWDPRSGKGVWETSEPGGGGGRSSRFGDPFADADVDREELKIYKVCSKSGDVGMADMRRLGEDPWVYMEERSGGLRSSGGEGGGDNIVHCYKKQVFVSRDSGLEVWSQVKEEDDDGEEEEEEESEDKEMRRRTTYRRNYVDKEEDARRGVINMMEAGGERLFVCREGMEGVEVWESSGLSAAISLF